MGDVSAGSFLPIAAIVAIALFVLKEAIEFGKRYHADERKLKAIKILVARECEFNHWALKRLRDILETIQSEMKKGRAVRFSVEHTKGGKVFFWYHRPDGQKSGSSIADVRNEILGKQLLEIAALDEKLYQIAEKGNTAVALLEHVREGIPYYIEEDPEHLDGFPQYGLSRLDEVLADVSALYFACTGKKLESHRLW